MGLRSYAGNAKRTTLAGDITASTTVFNLSDASSYPSPAAAEGPFVIALDVGLTTEEKILISSRSGNTLTVAQRGFDGTAPAGHSVGSSVDHTLSATDIREINAHAFDVTGDPHPQYLTPTEGAQAYAPITHTHAASTIVKTVPWSKTFTVAGEVKVAIGDDFFIPPFVVRAGGATVKLVAASFFLNSGTSVTVDLRANGVAVAGYSGLTVTTTQTNLDPADVTLVDGQKIALVVSAVAGTPKNMTFDLFLETTV